MKEQNSLRRIFRIKEDWLEEVFSQSNSQGSLKLAKTAVKSFSHFCQTTLEIPDPDIEDLKEKRDGFLCITCIIEKHFITDKKVMRFLKKITCKNT
jgi:hypothetical protein